MRRSMRHCGFRAVALGACWVASQACGSKNGPVQGSERQDAATQDGSSGTAGVSGGTGASAASGTGGAGGAAGRKGVGGGGQGSGGNAGAAGHGTRGLSGASGVGSGTGGSAGTSGAGGASGSGSAGRSYSTNRDDFFGASRCGNAGLLLCDDFESGSLNTALWKVKSQTPTFDSTRAARGSQSVHFHTTATSISGIETTKIFPANLDTYYGRLFVYFEAVPTSPQWAHWTIVGANPTSASSIKGEIRVGGQFDGTINRFGVGTDGGPTGDWTNLDNDKMGGTTKVPEGQWICIEWMHDGDSDQTRFFWDGVEHPSLDTTKDTKHQGNASVQYTLPDFASVWVGFWNYDQGKTVVPDHFDVWIDEVALDSARIGCDL